MTDSRAPAVSSTLAPATGRRGARRAHRRLRSQKLETLKKVALLPFLAMLLATVPGAGSPMRQGGPSAPAQEAPQEEEEPQDRLAKEFRDWLEAVGPLITPRERGTFLALKQDYQRRAFIRRFWESRDPFPQTPRNELKDRWDSRIELARGTFGGLQDDRARVFLLHGPPQGGFKVKCTTTRIPAEVWAYDYSDQVDFPFVVIFVRGQGGRGPARVWRPTATPRLQQALSAARRCINGEQLNRILSAVQRNAQDYETKISRVLARPRARSEEWLDTFAAYSTDLPGDAELLPAGLEIDFPGRYNSRTVVQGMVSISRDTAAMAEFAGHRSFDFQLLGEVILDGELFESFRYKYGYPVDAFDSPVLPLAFQRFLRPGEYTLVLRVQDLNSNRFFRREMPLEVRAVDELADLPPARDFETARLFEEATQAIARGEISIRIVPPREALQTGFVRIDTLAAGKEIERVRFLLDGRPLMTKNRPPFNVEIDLGQFPRRHALRVEAFDADDRELAYDEIDLNSGGNRFSIRLIEPRKGKYYDRSLQARAEVQIPEGREIERVEFFLDNDLLATLYQPPYLQPIALPKRDGEVSYVRAVAYLPDGNSTEDLVFINAPGYFEEVNVQFVELYTTVLDGRGRPVQGLSRDDFTISEDGVRQEVVRFEKVENLPIHAGILIDNSGSMHSNLGDVRKAALSFLEQAITPRDRAAVITFNKFPHLAVKLTNDLATLGGGLAGLVPEGETALYDSLIFSLYYFTGIRGQRAILLLSDGRDESSKFSFEETLEYARRAGVTVYAIGLGPGAGDVRGKLTRLAEETGGRSFFLRDAEGLEEIYRSIQEELRSQYLIAYQSSNSDDSGEFRNVELKVTRPNLKINTISGYYP